MEQVFIGSPCQPQSASGAFVIDPALNDYRERPGAWPGAALLGIIALAGALRVVGLENEVLYSDEAFSWRVATCPLDELTERVAGDTHPLLHFVLLRAVMLVWGDGLFVLRSVSIAAGLGSVAFAYLLCLEAFRFSSVRIPASATQQTMAALFAALIVAAHPLHIEFSRTARMYSLAAFLTAANCWLLLRCLEAPRRLGWWAALGAVAGLNLHTHNYALFALAGQGMFVLWHLCARRDKEILPGIAVAATVAVVVYAPWIPTFAAQAVRVRASFWIPPLNFSNLIQTANSWLFGLRTDPTWVAPWTLFTIAAVVMATVRRPDRATAFLATQAAVPWILTILVSVLGSRPLLQDRYLIVASIPFIVLLAISVARLANPTLRLLWAVNVMVPLAYGAISFVQHIPSKPPSIEDVVRYLDSHRLEDDRVIAAGAADVNVLLYYMRRAGVSTRLVQCPKNEEGWPEVHVNHVSSLRPDEFVDVALLSGLAQQIWVVNSAFEPSEDEWELTSRETFELMQHAYPHGYQLSLYRKVGEGDDDAKP